MTVPCVVICGPTASGKSTLAIRAATALAEGGHPAEIVNADSMLVYRGLDIGTAKPSEAERALVPHHLIDIYELSQPATVADFQRLARSAISEIRARGAIPIVVGGSALYQRAITDEFEFPGTDPELRARLEAELAVVGAAALHGRLADIAPLVAAEIQPGNARRIVRALEVIELTGSFSPVLPSWQYALSNVWSVGLELERSAMDERIAERVAQMWAAGLVAEVKRLDRLGLRQAKTASRAIGYRQVLSFLDGAITEAEAIEQTITATRRFSRKQLSWFRRDARISWRDALDPDLGESLVLDIVSRLGESDATT